MLSLMSKMCIKVLRHLSCYRSPFRQRAQGALRPFELLYSAFKAERRAEKRERERERKRETGREGGAREGHFKVN